MKYPKYKKDLEYSYVLGATLVFELINNRVDSVIKVLYSSKLHSDLFQKLKNLCHKKNLILELDDKNINYLSDKENCYVIGICRKDYYPLTNNNHLLLVNPSNAGNLGTIIRTALGFNINNLAIIIPTVDVFDPKTIRASMGAIFRMNICLYSSIEEYFDNFKKHTKYSFMLQSKQSLQSLKKINKPYTLIFGNEATGLPINYLEITDSIIINHSNLIDSLNLQTAVSIALYEFDKLGGDQFD